MLSCKHEEVLNLALEATQTGVWDWHLPSGRVTRTGPWYDIYGVQPDGDRKTYAQWQSSVHPEDRPAIDRALQDHLEGKTAEYFAEFRIFRKSGECRWIEGHGRVVERDDEGRPVRMVGTDSDITDRKGVEADLAKAKHAAEAASRAKSEFLANVSHEIRTPMTAVLGYTDLLLNLNLPEKQRRQYLHVIHRNAEALLTLINDILDLSRIEADRVQLHKVPCCPVDLVEDVVALLRGRALDKGLCLEIVPEYPLPETILTDPARLRQILVNLVGNAVKFTDRGRVRIGVRVEAPCGGRPRFEFVVADDGIGIDAGQLPRLFDPFHQVDTSATRRYGGTGLGLPISKRLAEMLGGDIQVESYPGQGSRFTVSIDPGPLDGGKQLADTRPAAAASTATAASPPRLHGRVLAVEDSRDIQTLLRLVLEGMGLEADVASNGLIGCEMAARSRESGQPYDVILMDIQMPEFDGYEASQRLRREGWQGPIIALTAHAMLGDREKCLDAGCDGYIPKPIDQALLRSTLARCLGQAEPLAPSPPALADSPKPLGTGMIDADRLASLVAGFATELPERAKRVAAAWRLGNLGEMRAATHQLKGTAGAYGYLGVAEAAHALCQAVDHQAAEEVISAAMGKLEELCRTAAAERRAT